MAADRIRIEVTGESRDLQAALARSRDAIRGVGDESDRQTTRAGRHFDRLRAKLRRPIQAKVEAQTAQAEAQFDRLQAQIKEVQREKAEIKATADTSQADARLSALRGEMRKLERQRIKLKPDADTTEIDAKIAKVSADVRELERQRAEIKVSADTSDADARLRALRSQVRSFGRESATASAGVNRLNVSTGGLASRLSVLRTVLRGMTFVALIAGAGMAVQALSALAAGAVALTSALAPLSGTLIALPGFMAAAAQGMGVAKFATGGLKEALGGLHEPLDETSKAFKQLGPEAQGFARYLQQLKPHFRDLQQIAQRGLFPGLREGLHEAMRNFPVIKRLVDQTSRALGAMAASAGKALGSAEWGRDLAVIGTRNVSIMNQLGAAAGHVANAIRHIWVAAGPTLFRLSDDVRKLTRNFEESAEAGRKSGRLGAFFERSRQVLHQVARIAADVAVAIRNIGRAAGPTGQRLLNSISEAAERWRAWTGSMRGQNALRDYFTRAEPNIRAMAGVIGRLGRALINIGAAPGLAKTLNLIRDRLIPAIEHLVTQMTTVAGPHIIEALASLADLFAELSPYIADVAAFVADAAKFLADLVREEPAVGTLVATVGGLGLAFKVLKFTGIIKGLELATKAARALLVQLGLINAAGAAGGAAGAAGAAGGAAAGAGAGAAGGGAMAALKKWGGKLLKFGATRAFLPVAIVATVGEIIGWDKIHRFLSKLNPIKAAVEFVGKKIGPVWKDINRFLGGFNPIKAAVEFVGKKIGPVWDDAKRAVRKAVQFIGRKIGNAWRDAKKAVRKAVQFIGKKVGDLWRTAKNAVRKAIKFVGEKAGDLWNTAKDVWKKVIEFVSDAVGDLWRNAKDVWDKSIRFVAVQWGSLWRTAGRTITKIVRFVADKIGFAEGGIAPGFAQGGGHDNAPTRKSTGGRHSRPTFLVGEENRPEFVIATNPRYRKANLGYLQMAAAALGAPMVPAFAPGGRYPGGFGHTFDFSGDLPRARRYRRGMPQVRDPRRRRSWMTSLGYGLAGARERESFYELMGKGRGGRTRRQWAALSPGMRERVTNWWEGRSEMIGRRHEYWEQRLEAFKELWGQLQEILSRRRGQHALGQRLGRAQTGVIGQFAQQWRSGKLVGGLPFVGSFARGTGGRTIKRSGLAELHRGETVTASPTSGYGSQLRPQVAAPPVTVNIYGDEAGFIKKVDARIAGQSAPVVSQQIGRRQRVIRSAPGQTRAAFAR